jgi:hypothetical protein
MNVARSEVIGSGRAMIAALAMKADSPPIAVRAMPALADLRKFRRE